MQPNPAFPVMIKGEKGFQKPITFNQKKNWCLQVLSIGDIGFSAGFKDSYWVHLWGLTPGSDTKPRIPADFVKNSQPMFSLSLSLSLPESLWKVQAPETLPACILCRIDK